MSAFAPVTSDTPAFLAEDISPSLIACASVFIVLTTAFVVLRYYARYLTHTRFGLEDIIIPFAWLAEIGLCITAIVMVKKAGTGRHMDFVLRHNPLLVMEHFKGIIVVEVLHLPAVAFPKLCVVILYLRVFTNKWARLATWALIYIIAATWFSYTIATMFQCIPFKFNWDKSDPKGRCFDVQAFAASSSVPNIVTDIIVLFLPIRTIMDLKVSVGKRIGLGIIFLTGSFGIIASIIRTVVFSHIDPLGDATFKHVELVKWTIIEPGTYLMAACALSFKPLFRMVAHSLHLDSLLTHTRTQTRKLTGKSGARSRSGTLTSNMHMETVTASHAHFNTLDEESHEGTSSVEDDDVDMGRGAKRNGVMDIVITKTWETDVEDMTTRSESFELQEARRESVEVFDGAKHSRNVSDVV